MKKSVSVSFLAIALVVSSVAFAEGTADEHAAHHPKDQTATQSTDKGGAAASDMGGMKMDDMMGMMHECMGMHKDGKMCDHEAMQKCQEKMGKGDCMKMMKHAKAQKEPKTKK